MDGPGRPRHSIAQNPYSSVPPLNTANTVASRNDESANEAAAASSETPTSRMLRSSGGDRVFVGPTATLSFVQFLRDSLARRTAGLHQSSEGGPNETMFEGEPVPLNESDRDMKDAELLKTYAKSYLLSTSGILQVFTAEELMSAIDTLTADADHHEPSIDNLAAVYIAIAIGARSRKQSDLDDSYASAYFHAARNAGEDPLAMPTVRSTTISVLMAFFMLTSHRRNAAYMYLGAAARAAHALGLHHQSSYHGGTDFKILQRLWLWKSICVLDIIVSSILGRLPAVNVQHVSDNTDVVARFKHRLNTRGIAFEAAFRASRTIGEIASKMTNGARLSVADTEEYLQRLATWNTSLPDELRSIVPNHLNKEAPEHSEGASIVVASMNVACSYYYAIILLTRPFLIATHGISSGMAAQEAASVDTTMVETKRLASVCVDSAVYMVETICNAKKTGSLLPNTCFIRAWLFTAALILGFSMSMNPNVSDEASLKAFRLSSDLLRDNSAISPHARQYYVIVEDVRNLIDVMKSRMTNERRERNRHYVDRVVRYPDGWGDIFDAPMPIVQETPELENWGASIFDETQEIFFSGWEEYIDYDLALDGG